MYNNERDSLAPQRWKQHCTLIKLLINMLGYKHTWWMNDPKKSLVHDFWIWKCYADMYKLQPVWNDA